MNKNFPFSTIYNQDCSNIFASNSSDTTFKKESLDKMLDEVKTGAVDVMLINTNAYVGRTNFMSRTFRPMWQQNTKTENIRPAILRMKYLHDSGINYLSYCLDGLEKRGITKGVSIRMNDIHNTPWPDDPIHGDFYRAHKEWRIEAPYHESGDYAFVNAMDYSIKEVREYYLSFIKEIVFDYKPKVLELDFMRYPLYFPSEKATERKDIMTNFIREIRKMTKNNIYLISRLPACPCQAMELGFDLFTIASDSLFDCIIPTGHFNTSWDMDIEGYRKIFKDSTAIFPSTESSAFAPNGLNPAAKDDNIEGVMGLNDDLLRGFSNAGYAKGANGVYLFNLFCSKEWKRMPPLFNTFKELKSPDNMLESKNTYAITAGNGGWFLGESDGILQVPRKIEKRIPVQFDIYTGIEKPGRKTTIRFLINGKMPEPKNAFTLYLNSLHLLYNYSFEPIQNNIDDEPSFYLSFETVSEKLKSGLNKIILRSKNNSIQVGLLTITIENES